MSDNKTENTVKPGNAGKWQIAALASIIVIAILFALLNIVGGRSTQENENALTVYCAAGLKMPVSKAAKEYTEEFGIPVKLEYASSGVLEGKLKQNASFGKTLADLYIPADHTFALRTKQKGLTRESLPLAKFRLVLAVKPDDDLQFASLKDLIAKKIPYAICNEQAGAGFVTRETLKSQNLWQEFHENKKVVCDKVTECASSIKTSNSVQAGIIWNTTALQFGLKIIEVPELKNAEGFINVNITRTAKAVQALHFARFLSSPQKGTPHFSRYGFGERSGDKWTETPQITVQCDPMFKSILVKTFADFEAREGVKIEAFYQSPHDNSNTTDLLIANIDLLNAVQKNYEEPLKYSYTDVAIAVKKNNPLSVNSLEDLMSEKITTGIVHKGKNSLGNLTSRIINKAGFKNDFKNRSLKAENGEELLKMLTAGKIDTAIIYKTDYEQFKTTCDVIDINNYATIAVQHLAVKKTSLNKSTIKRLIKKLNSTDTQARLTKNGFNWIDNE